MQQVLAIALAAMHQDMNRLDRVAVNLANVATPGYKREVVAARPASPCGMRAIATQRMTIWPPNRISMVGAL